jgi:hypothetical protein
MLNIRTIIERIVTENSGAICMQKIIACMNMQKIEFFKQIFCSDFLKIVFQKSALSKQKFLQGRFLRKKIIAKSLQL